MIFKNNKETLRILKIWGFWAILFSALPVLLNLLWDYINMGENTPWRGVRLIDFIICGFCLIGSACHDGFVTKKISTTSIAASLILCMAGLFIYSAGKYETDPTETGLYRRETFFTITIIGFYLLSIVVSSISIYRYNSKSKKE